MRVGQVLCPQHDPAFAAAKVEFFQGDTKSGEDPTAPYEQSVSLTQADNGPLSFTAKAIDKGENESELSNAVSVNVDIRFATLVRSSKSRTEFALPPSENS